VLRAATLAEAADLAGCDRQVVPLRAAVRPA